MSECDDRLNGVWQHEMHVVAGAAALVGQVLTHYREGKTYGHKTNQAKVVWGTHKQELTWENTFSHHDAMSPQ